jgi:hypothetical protein
MLDFTLSRYEISMAFKNDKQAKHYNMLRIKILLKSITIDDLA